MKKFALLSILFAFVLFTGCKTDTIQVYYDETKCLDKWGSNENTPENEKIQSIAAYFDDLNIHIYDVEIVNDGTLEGCEACSCKTGNRVHCKVSKNDLDKIKLERFYE